MLHVLSQEPSIVNEFLAELRDVNVQQDRSRFRRNLERIGMAMGLILSRELNFSDHSVSTPLGIAKTQRLTEQPVLATILRAGLPLHYGLASVFDRADQAFISACRKYREGDHDSFYIGIDAVSSPRLDNRTLILADPMLATGASLVHVLDALVDSHGRPSAIHVVAAIASEEGVAAVQAALPADAHIWIGDVDRELSGQGYIIPGLGDAGDLAFGSKE